jgi:hypothetical protein
MRATPKELASRNNSEEMREWILTETDPRKIQELFHLISVLTHGSEFALGKQAIGILIAESADASAHRLEKSTKHLLLITYVLVALTLVLAVFTYFLVKHECGTK